MRLQLSKSKNATSLYIVKSTYDRNGKRSNKVVRKLGTVAELSKLYDDPVAWGESIAAEMTRQEEEEKANPVSVQYDPNVLIEKEKRNSYNIGYLFLQKIYYELGLDKICKTIEKKYKFEYDLNDIMRCLVYGRVLFPASKAKTSEESEKYLEHLKIEQHQVYRALSVIAEENDYIQAELYKNSCKVVPRNNNVLYYDCTNFFFEIEEEKGIRKYGNSKEHRPNPIVEMGLFTDGNGMPLAFCIHSGNTNEQVTLKPLEKKILQDFGKAKVVVCTDSGLSSDANRKFNSVQGRAFITVQSLKKMTDRKKAWALGANGWKLVGSNKEYDLNELFECEDSEIRESNTKAYYDSVFYKEEWFKDNGLEQRYIVTFSLKYRDYLRSVRERQVQRAEKNIEQKRAPKKNANDPMRFVDQICFTDTGEVADNTTYMLNKDTIAAESVFDGFYCTATNLEDPVESIIAVNKRRWEIEESFRIMKTDFRSRPVYLQRDDRIKAHFLTCFLSLYVYRILEKKLNEQYTTDKILDTLRSMDCVEISREGYIPAYKRTDLTDLLHETFGFRTDYQILTLSESRKILRNTRKK